MYDPMICGVRILKKMDMGNDSIDSTVRKPTFILKLFEESKDIFVSDIGRTFVKSILDEIKINTDIGAV